MAKRNEVIISRLTLKSLIIAIIVLLGIILSENAIIASFRKQQTNPLGYLEGTYRYSYSKPEVNSLNVAGGSNEWYLKLETNGRCYSNIPFFQKKIGLCYWKQSKEDKNYIIISQPLESLPSNGEMNKNESIIARAEFGKDYIRFLGLMLYKEE